jgi:hypothetical protein
MHVISSSEHAEHLNGILRSNAARPVQLLFVEDIAEWAAETGAKVNGNPNATALIGGESREWLIVVREAISEEKVASNINAMDIFENHGECIGLLNTPERFLEHTVLHELAHLILGVGNESESLCNAWAFQRLGASAA